MTMETEISIAELQRRNAAAQQARKTEKAQQAPAPQQQTGR
ncbi:hypothetical protein ACFV6Z_18620 [Streptomyces sp. NPDC059818]